MIGTRREVNRVVLSPYLTHRQDERGEGTLSNDTSQLTYVDASTNTFNGIEVKEPFMM